MPNDTDAAARQLEEAQASLRRMAAARDTADHGRADADETQVPAVNPYFGDLEVRMTHRVFETFARELAEMREALVAEGWRRGQVTQAQLLMAIMHKAWPHSISEASDLLRDWSLVQAAPPPRGRTSCTG